ncbi:MAG TPA: TolC family protein [Elusimicrobiales bacterium]|jgi:outer membrane protein TolC|nr:TolC family protein [Elusimicrobiales bacterium]HPO95760.1 TolC family protein [Elusimicrobiales bacterium]
MKLIMAVVFFSFSRLNAQYTVEKAVSDAVNSSNLIKSYDYKVKEAEHNLKEADYSKYGILNLKALYTKGDEPVYAFASKMRQGEFSMADMMKINNPDSIDNLELAIEAGVPLFTGFKLENYKKMSGINIEANKKITEEVKNGIKFQAIYSYLTAVMYKSLLSLSSSTISSSEIELSSAKKLNEKGMIFGSDYYAALSIYEFIKKYDTEWKNSFEREIRSLSVLTGKNISQNDIKSILKEYEWKTESKDFYINYALKNRNSLKAYDDYINIREIQKEINKNSILPEVVAFASLSGNSGSLSDMRTSSIYGIKMNMPIGDPTYFAKIDKSEAILNQTKELKNDEVRKISDEIEKTYSDMLSAYESMKIAKNAVLNAENSLELFKPLYRQGKQSIMEVLRAESNLLQAKASYYEAIFKYNLFYAKLRYLTQTLDERFIKDLTDKISE